MIEHRPPERRMSAAATLDRSLLATLGEMLDDNETITARAIIRRMGAVDHASTLTRDSWRSGVIESFQSEQARLRRMMEKSDKSSKSNLAASLAREKAKVEQLEAKVALLTASHYALILAVGEMGGMRAWSQFFKEYSGAINGLRDLGALPAATVQAFPPSTGRKEPG